MDIKLLDLKRAYADLKPHYDSAYERVMSKGQFILGEEVKRFEQAFADFCDVDYCVGVGNGYDALVLLLKAYEIRPGDEVIVPSITFIATWTAITNIGAVPVMVDVDSTHTIDVTKIEEKITDKTRAIIPVHLYGQPCDMFTINEIANEYNLIVIEDAAQAHGAMYCGRSVGGLGDSAAFSFYPGKNLGAFGDAGCITTNDSIIADRVRMLRNYGSTEKYKHECVGVNSRMDELQAAFLYASLNDLHWRNYKRKEIAANYLTKLEGVGLPLVLVNTSPVWHQFVIKHPKRDELKQWLSECGIETGIHYPTPPGNQPIYSDKYYSQRAQDICDELLSIPIDPFLTQKEVDFIIESILKYTNEHILPT